MYTATYSPDDNKLRLYASTRLDPETYAKVKAAGFRWAPKQELFVAPAWTPQREDLLLELAGQIDDEDTSLTDRAADRAERFEGYQERRAQDAESARVAVKQLADGIPFGQPILVGHHSERRARKDAERIENGMRKAVKMWKTSEYWRDRAAGAIGHAKYKELPTVRARRIKTLEAELRKVKRSEHQAQTTIKAWLSIQNLDQAILLAGHGYSPFGVYSELKDGKITAEQAQERVLAGARSSLSWAERWITHLENRLTYERAMLAESGYTPPVKPKKTVLPLLNYSGEVAYRNLYQRGEVIRGQAVGVTKAELAKINADYKGTRVSECGTHRIRVAMLRRPGDGHALSIVYLTDSKQHQKPAPKPAPAVVPEPEPIVAKLDPQPAAVVDFFTAHPEIAVANQASEYEAMAQSLKAGVKVVSSPDLFPTPADLASRMVTELDLLPGQTVLEPSAGTGALVDAIARHRLPTLQVSAVERNPDLARAISQKYGISCLCGDFLESSPELQQFDRVVMNPPFSGGADIKHIRHALTFLKPGGRLVALCANGPRQQAQLQPLADSWEELPAGTFNGTGVRAALLTVSRS